MDYTVKVLPNGLTLLHYYLPHSTISHAGCLVNVGSRDEQEHENGMAHLIEHCLFKGTTKRKAFHILNRLDSVGGEVNAYTTKEETAVYASFLTEYTGRALELLGDMVFDSVFPEKQIINEKSVIADEIASYEDSPSEQIFDDFEQYLFPNQALGRSILGTESSLGSIQKPNILKFYQQFYTPQNTIVAYMGNLPSKKFFQLATKHFSAYASTGVKNSRILQNPLYKPFNLNQEKEINQAHVLIGGLADSYQSKARRAVVLLNNILGGPAMNSRLNLNIREKYGFAYSIESSYTSLVDTGIFSVYLGVAPKSLNKSIQLVHKELKKLRDNKLSDLQLHYAKKQLIGQIALNQEGSANNMLGLAKSWQLFEKIEDLATVYNKINALTANELLEAANRIFSESNLSTLIYQPK